MVGVPDTVPVVAPMVTPAGSPLADHVYGAVPPEADRVKDAMADPTVPDMLPGLETVTVPVEPQVGSAAWAGTETAFHAALTLL